MGVILEWKVWEAIITVPKAILNKEVNDERTVIV